MCIRDRFGVDVEFRVSVRGRNFGAFCNGTQVGFPRGGIRSRSRGTRGSRGRGTGRSGSRAAFELCDCLAICFPVTTTIAPTTTTVMVTTTSAIVTTTSAIVTTTSAVVTTETPDPTMVLGSGSGAGDEIN